MTPPLIREFQDYENTPIKNGLSKFSTLEIKKPYSIVEGR
jgi:hypothetical protein